MVHGQESSPKDESGEEKYAFSGNSGTNSILDLFHHLRVASGRAVQVQRSVRSLKNSTRTERVLLEHFYVFWVVNNLCSLQNARLWLVHSTTLLKVYCILGGSSRPARTTIRVLSHSLHSTWTRDQMDHYDELITFVKRYSMHLAPWEVNIRSIRRNSDGTNTKKLQITWLYTSPYTVESAQIVFLTTFRIVTSNKSHILPQF